MFVCASPDSEIKSYRRHSKRNFSENFVSVAVIQDAPQSVVCELFSVWLKAERIPGLLRHLMTLCWFRRLHRRTGFVIDLITEINIKVLLNVCRNLLFSLTMQHFFCYGFPSHLHNKRLISPLEWSLFLRASLRSWAALWEPLDFLTSQQKTALNGLKAFFRNLWLQQIRHEYLPPYFVFHDIKSKYLSNNTINLNMLMSLFFF